MNILFVSEARYPTTKAYGVTIGRTAESAKLMGHDTRILAPNFQGFDIYGNCVVSAIPKLYDLTYKFFKHSFVLFTFQIISMLVSTFISIIRFKPDVVWCRHPINSVLALFFKKSKIAIEIHHVPNRVNMRLLNLLRWNQNLLIFTLSNHHVLEFQNKGMKCEPKVLPMAAPINFSHSNEQWPKSSASIRICYLGRLLSSGKSNGIAEFVTELNILFQTGLDFDVTLAGLSKSEVDKILENYTSKDFRKRIFIVENIEHHEIDKFLQSIDIGVIPYPSSIYNEFRFPIKAIEYARMRCLIVASKLKIHQEIIGEDKAFFYEHEIVGDFSRVIQRISQEKALARSKVEKAFRWSLNLNYQNRVEHVIDSVRDLK